ncbi:prenylated rab acceptor 1 [Apiospora kogelbergensis]|uniref:prenylated rab acceptor 1 n=1 Tax=Apiospora kogelbergensis TaxID=1337665 RepID=UPI0031319AD2
MASRIQIPLDVLTSRLNISDRFAGFRNTSLSSRFSNLRPVSEFCDFKRLSKPQNFGEMQSRVNYNLGHFSSNYAACFFILSIYALVTSPLLLFDIVLLFAGLWLLGKMNGEDLVIGTFRATSSQCYTALLVTVAILGLIAPTFSTVLWLLGASGVTIIGHAAFMDKPIDEAFSGEADGEAPQNGDQGFWSQGEEWFKNWTAMTRIHKALVWLQVLDGSLFTGTELARGGRPRGGHAYDEDDSSEEESGGEDTEEEDEDDEARQLEDELVEHALAKIRKAQAKGKQDVKLNKQELAALERRRKRVQAEAERAAKPKQKPQRIAVPLSQFDPSAMEVPRRRSGMSASEDTLSRDPSSSSLAVARSRPGPPVGYFPPPNASRHRSSTSLHRASSSARNTPDPFKYQTAGSRVSSGHGKRNMSGSSDPHGRRGASSAARNSRAQSSDEDEDETTSDDTGNGVHISRNRTPPEEIVVVEASPSPEPGPRTRSKASSSKQSPVKKKSASGTSGGGKKRAKANKHILPY